MRIIYTTKPILNEQSQDESENKKKKNRNLQSIKPKSLDCVCVGFICCANDDDLDIFNLLTQHCA